jgi:Matrixin
VRAIYKSSKFLLILLLVFTTAAMAYTPQFVGEAGILRLQWKTPIIRIALSSSLNAQNTNIKPNSDVAIAIQRSLEKWEKVANIKFQTVPTEKQSSNLAGNSGDGVSLITIAQTPENLLLFADDSEEVSARTRTFYNRRGFITEADIVLNPYQQFSTDGSFGTFDLEATLTHEIGHLLGLEHSFIFGATMHAHQGKNGMYNLPNFSSRSLADNDIAAVRALYGAKTDDETCCGSIAGRLSLAYGKPARDFQIWAEDAETGRVVAGVLTASDGSFRMAGLPAGEYRIFSQKTSEKADNSYLTENLGSVEVQNEKQSDLVKKLQSKPETFNARYVGFNGQLSELSVPTEAGKTYTIYLGGKNFDLDEMSIAFNSPYISAIPNSFVKEDYGADVSVVRFEVKIGGKTPSGEYGIYIKYRNGKTESLPGSLVVETAENLANAGVLPANE